MVAVEVEREEERKQKGKQKSVVKKTRNEGFGIELITRVGTLWKKGARNRERERRERREREKRKKGEKEKMKVMSSYRPDSGFSKGCNQRNK